MKGQTEHAPAGRGTATYRVKVLHSSAVEYAVADEPLERGEHVIVPTRYGKALAVVLGRACALAELPSQDVVKVERKATAEDLDKEARNRERAERAFAICQEKIAQRDLPMKLVAAHYLLLEPKIVFFFTADERVDFRDLVKDLVQVFRMRVELRQIGVRDESRLIGGLGVCGRPFCCHRLTDRMSPVSIRMAKKQDLSLNSTKISGPCGRLLCCLAYEYSFYAEETNRAPAVGTRIAYQGENCRVSEVNVLSRRIRLAAPSGRMVSLRFEDVRYDPAEKRWSVVDNGGQQAEG